MTSNERKYFDFVLCTHEGSEIIYLYHAPAFSHLEKGDMVTVETRSGKEQVATVVQTITVEETELELIDFVMNATGAPSDVKKVISRIMFDKFDYDEEIKTA